MQIFAIDTGTLKAKIGKSVLRAKANALSTASTTRMGIKYKSKWPKTAVAEYRPSAQTVKHNLRQWSAQAITQYSLLERGIPVRVDRTEYF
jgi:hypothetical protein